MPGARCASTLGFGLWTLDAHQRMKACVIFNPVARGDKARDMQSHLSDIARDAALKPTTCAGDARQLAAEAVREGFDTVVAAGGDGTLNEVLNGLADADGFSRARLGVLPRRYRTLRVLLPPPAGVRRPRTSSA